MLVINNIDEFTEGADDDDGIVSDDKISASSVTGIFLILFDCEGWDILFLSSL